MNRAGARGPGDGKNGTVPFPFAIARAAGTRLFTFAFRRSGGGPLRRELRGRNGELDLPPGRGTTRYRPVVATERRENADQFPFSEVIYPEKQHPAYRALCVPVRRTGWRYRRRR